MTTLQLLDQAFPWTALIQVHWIALMIASFGFTVIATLCVCYLTGGFPKTGQGCLNYIRSPDGFCVALFGLMPAVAIMGAVNQNPRIGDPALLDLPLLARALDDSSTTVAITGEKVVFAIPDKDLGPKMLLGRSVEQSIPGARYIISLKDAEYVDSFFRARNHPLLALGRSFGTTVTSNP
jgi:hypothetical protein